MGGDWQLAGSGGLLDKLALRAAEQKKPGNLTQRSCQQQNSQNECV
jgi:hypothetical protein